VCNPNSQCSDAHIYLDHGTEVAVCIRVLRDLRACQRWKGRDDANSEWSYGAEKDCPAARVTGPGLRVPPCHLPPPQVSSGDHAQRLPGFEALTIIRG